MEFLITLNQHRPISILVEFIGMVHDVGKLDERVHEYHLARPLVELGFLEDKEIRSLFEPEFSFLSQEQYNSFDDVKRDLRKNSEIVKQVNLAVSKFKANESNEWKKWERRCRQIWEGCSQTEGIKIQEETKKFILSNPLEFSDSELIKRLIAHEDKIARVGTPIIRHHYAKIPYFSIFRDRYPCQTLYEWIIGKCDTKDSIEDREGVESDKPPAFAISTPFGYEIGLKEKNLFRVREEFYNNINVKSFKKSLQENDSLKLKNICDVNQELIKRHFSMTVSMNARPVNDILLYDHGFMSGAMSKCVFNQMLFQYSTGKGIEWIKDPSIEASKMPFSALTLIFNSLSFLTNVYKLPDLIGRQFILERLFKDVKSLLEQEIPIGSAVYEDINTITFLTPELDSNVWDELLEEIKGKTFKTMVSTVESELQLSMDYAPLCLFMLNPEIKLLEPEERVANLIQEGIAKSTDFLQSKKVSEITLEKLDTLDKIWQENNSEEKCQVCGLLPATIEDRDDKICKVCSSLRAWGWFSNREEARKIKEEEKIPQSIWLDEIKDKNNVIALVFGKIAPIEEWLKSKEEGGYVEKSTFVNVRDKKEKTLSASRARAIWRTVDEFCSSCMELSEKHVDTGVGAIIKYDKSKLSPEPPEGNLNVEILFEDKKTEGYWTPQHNTIETLLSLSEDDLQKLLSVKELKMRYKKKEWTVRSPAIEKKEYLRTRKVYSFAGEFCSIVPGDKALDICAEVKEKFEREFGKVLGRLSLSLGIIYFKHKTPLYIAFDSAKRMLKNFEKLSEKEEVNIIETRKILKLKLPTGHESDPIVFDKHEEFIEEIKEYKKRKEEVDAYIELSLAKNDRRFKWNIPITFMDGELDCFYPYVFVNKEVKHVLELKEAESIQAHLNYFDFEFLDASSRRFDIILPRSHFLLEKSPRPYLLEDLEKLVDLWRIFDEHRMYSKIKNLEALCGSKLSEWDTKNPISDRTYLYFVEMSLKNVLGRTWNELKEEERNFLKESLSTGMFFDVIELYMRIMKKKIGGG